MTERDYCKVGHAPSAVSACMCNLVALKRLHLAAGGLSQISFG